MYKILRNISSFWKVFLSASAILLTLTLISLRVGAAGVEDLDVGTSGLPQANGADSTIYLPIAISDHPFNTLFGYEYSSIGENHGLQEMRNAGANWVRRAGIWWPDVEPTKGTYDWSQLSGFEAEFLQADSKNMRVIVIVRGTPAWAQADAPYNRTCGRIKTSEFASFAAFLGELVTRYSYAPFNVKYWELYNEPDVYPDSVPPGNEWMGCWGDPSDPYYGGGYYANMLKDVYPAVKAANPDAQVLVGGLLLDCDPIDVQLNCEDPTTSLFLKGIFENGGGPYFDGVSFHAYDYYNNTLGEYSLSKWDSQWNTTGPSLIAKTAYLRSVLSDYGASSKLLLNTESAVLCDTAWNVCETVFETTKTYYVTQSFVSAFVAGLDSNIWYFWTYRNSELLEPDNTPLPSYYTYKFARGQLKYATYNQEIATETGVRTYEFDVPGGGRLWVMWSLDGADHNGVTLPGTPAAVYDSDGDPITPASTIDVDLEPLYLEWDS